MYSREINGEEFTFGVSGKLIMNVLVMYDRQTSTLWSQLLGEAVEGELKGTRLEFLPSWQTTWEDWRTQHPETVALRKGFTGNFDPYNSYFSSGDPGVIGETVRDSRLYTKEFVIGVENEGEAAAYPFSVLNDQPVVNDTVAGLPLLVTFNPDTATGVVFKRLVDGEELDFSVSGDSVMTDAQTGSTWDLITGKATSGPLNGTTLERYKSTRSFWFGWKDFFPETRIYGTDP